MPKTLCILLLTAIFSMNKYAYAEEIVISGNAFKPPKIWLAENKKSSKGILVDIMHYAGKQLGVTFRIELYPWKRAYTDAERGMCGIVGISKNEERLKIFDYSESLYVDEVILVVKRGNEFKYETYEDLRDKIIGVCRGCSFGPEFEAAKKYFEVSLDNDNISRLVKLLYGRIDAAIISPGEAALQHIITYHDYKTGDQIPASQGRISRDQFSVLQKPIAKDPNFLAFSKDMQ